MGVRVLVSAQQSGGKPPHSVNAHFGSQAVPALRLRHTYYADTEAALLRVVDELLGHGFLL